MYTLDNLIRPETAATRVSQAQTSPVVPATSPGRA